MMSMNQLPLVTDLENPISPYQEHFEEENLKSESQVVTEKVLFDFYDDDEGGEDGEVDEDKMEESCERPKVRIISDPINPTKNEVREHRAAFHVPYRSWCRHCVRGKAKNDPTGRSRRSSRTTCPEYAWIIALWARMTRRRRL